MRVRIPRSALPPALCVGFAVILAFAMPLGATPSPRERAPAPDATSLALRHAGAGAASKDSSAIGPSQLSPREVVEAACGSFRPYYAVTNFEFADTAQPPPGDVPAILAFNASEPAATPAHFSLATQAQVGAVYGLAYDAARGTLYAAAYHKRATAFGPGGPGQVYAVELTGGAVRPFVRLDAGPDRHDYGPRLDERAAEAVGWTGLGDIDISPDGSTLFVVNLADGRIHRFALPSGDPLGSFQHGAAGEPWAENARPFGLGIADGWLFHGVVNTLSHEPQLGTLAAHIYRSQPDGSRMERLTELDFDYPRRLGWQPWATRAFYTSGYFHAYHQNSAEPILSDIEVSLRGELVLGVRDRLVDQLPALGRGSIPASFPGVGDLLLAREESGRWSAVTEPEPFIDSGAFEESSFGALARMPGFDLFVSPARSPHMDGPNEVGAFWNVLDSGGIALRENLRAITDIRGLAGSTGLGDVEALCERDVVVAPGVEPTATALAGTAGAAAHATRTANAQATGTATAVRIDFPTRMPTPSPTRMPLARFIAHACRSDNPYLATVCYAPNATGDYLAAVELVVFRDTPVDAPIYAVTLPSQVGAIWGLAYAGGRGTLYSAATNRRMVWFGPSGSGAIYQLSIADGLLSTLAVVPDAGPDYHGPAGSGDDQAADMVGKTSLGDIDLSTDERELYAVNLFNRRIYRFETASGGLLGSFDHGAAAEPWAADARPFALKFYRGRLYHGLVNSAQTHQRREDLWAEVHSSLPDGSDMRLEARVHLAYPRGTVPVAGVNQHPGIHEVPLDWQPWRDGYNDVSAGRTQLSIYPQPMLADIEFAASGDMMLGLKDRHNDMSMDAQRFIGGRFDKPGLGLGDVLRVPFDGTGWPGPARVDQYRSPADTEADHHAAGGLGFIEGFDVLLVNRLRVNADSLVTALLAVTPGVLWYDDGGNVLRHEAACQRQGLFRLPVQPVVGAAPAHRAPEAPQHSEWLLGTGTGDLEVLCGLTPPSQAIYLPIVLREHCPSGSARADGVLAVGPLTGMRRSTAGGIQTPGKVRAGSERRLAKAPGPLEWRCPPTPIPSATATATATATASPSPSPSPTVLPTATPSPSPPPSRTPLSPTATPVPCVPGIQPADIVLVFDRSSSMEAANKLADARAAVLAFVEAAQAPPDQLALVSFAGVAGVNQGLTSDKALLRAALQGLITGPGTRIDLGLQAARGELAGPRHHSGHSPVIILLSDGAQNGTPASTALLEADLAKAAGAILFTIGLGPDADRMLLDQIASSPAHAYFAPSGADLAAIYRRIAIAIPCPSPTPPPPEPPRPTPTVQPTPISPYPPNRVPRVRPI